jgi:hypothetical protein
VDLSQNSPYRTKDNGEHALKAKRKKCKFNIDTRQNKEGKEYFAFLSAVQMLLD